MSSAGVDAGPSRSAGNALVGDIWVNFKRWTRKAIRNPTVVFLELFMAVFSLLMFTAVFGDVGTLALEQAGFEGVGYLHFVLPAAVVQVSMSSALSSGLGLVEDLQTGMFEKVTVSPMRWTAVFAGKAAAELFRLVCYVFVIFGLGLTMGATVETGLLGLFGIALVCVLFALWYMALSNAVAVTTRDEETLDAVGNLLLFPLLFLSSAFLPASSLPEAAQVIATVNPVTYGVDAIRALVLGRDVLTVVEVTAFGGVYDTLVPALAVLCALDVVFGAVSVWLMGRATGSEVA